MAITDCIPYMIPLACFYAASTVFFLKGYTFAPKIFVLFFIYFATVAYGWWKGVEIKEAAKKAAIPTSIFVVWVILLLIPPTKMLWNFIGDSIFMIGLFTIGYDWLLRRDYVFGGK